MNELIRRNVLLATVSDCRRAGFRQFDSYIPIPSAVPVPVTNRLVLFREHESLERSESLIFTLGLVDFRGYRRWFGIEAWPGCDLPPGVWAGLSPQGRKQVLALAQSNLRRKLESLSADLVIKRLKGFPVDERERDWERERGRTWS